MVMPAIRLWLLKPQSTAMFVIAAASFALASAPDFSEAQTVSDAAQHCTVTTAGGLADAHELYAQQCNDLPRLDCDPVATGGWQCSSGVIGQYAPGVNSVDKAVEQAIELVAPEETSSNVPDICFSPRAQDLGAAIESFAASCSGYVRRDCDPFDGGWRCSSGVIGRYAPGVAELSGNDAADSTDAEAVPDENTNEENVTESETANTVTPQQPDPDPVDTATPSNNAVGRLQAGDLLSLHYDHCPDPDDGHAQAAGYSVVQTLGLDDVLVVHGTCGDGIRDRYDESSLALSLSIWGSDILDVAGNREASIEAMATRWAATLANGNGVWVAEGGQSDVTAATLQRLAQRSPELDLKRVTVVQHSAGTGAYNEDFSERLDEVRSRASYQTVPNGNAGGNGSADLAMQSSAFVARARASRFQSEWNTAFNYLDPSCATASYLCKLDFSDTVELLWIVGDDSTRTVDDFADLYID